MLRWRCTIFGYDVPHTPMSIPHPETDFDKSCTYKSWPRYLTKQTVKQWCGTNGKSKRCVSALTHAISCETPVSCSTTHAHNKKTDIRVINAPGSLLGSAVNQRHRKSRPRFITARPYASSKPCIKDHGSCPKLVRRIIVSHTTPRKKHDNNCFCFRPSSRCLYVRFHSPIRFSYTVHCRGTAVFPRTVLEEPIVEEPTFDAYGTDPTRRDQSKPNRFGLILPSHRHRTSPHRTAQHRAEPSRTEPNRPKPNRTEPNRIEPNRPEPNRKAIRFGTVKSPE